MKLRPVEQVAGISKAAFKKKYIDTRTPVILKDFLDQCVARQQWNYDYFREKAGNLTVAVHGSEDAHLDKVNSLAERKMTFADYLDLIQSGPTESRLFLFNLLVERPELKKELKVRKLADNLLAFLPLMFFGGAGSSTRYHYDIDLSHVFLTQFQGTKKVWLFPGEQSSLLYRLPFNYHGIADLRQPDYQKFPALQYLNGWTATLHHGDTLFMPSGYWHYIMYETDGFSVSHRALPASTLVKMQGFRNLFLTRRFDTLMRKLLKEKWLNYKKEVAYKRAAKAIAAQSGSSLSKA